MIPTRAFAVLLILATLNPYVVPVLSIDRASRPISKVEIVALQSAHLPTDGGATVTVQGKFLDLLNFRPAVSIGGHVCSRTYWIVESVRSVKISASIGCETPPGFGSADLRVDFYDDLTDSRVAWGLAPKSIRFLTPTVTGISPSIIAIPAPEKVLLSIDGRNLGEAHSSPYAAVYVGGVSVGQVVHRSSAVVMVIIEGEFLNQLSSRGSLLDVTLAIGNRDFILHSALSFCFSQSSCEKRGVSASMISSRSLLSTKRSLLTGNAPVVTRINPVRSAPSGGSAMFIYGSDLSVTTAAVIGATTCASHEYIASTVFFL